MNDDIVAALAAIMDPELDISIVDLGLVYQAEFSPQGIVVRFITTSPTCPVSASIAAAIATTLRRQFPDTAQIDVALTSDPPWSPERLSAAARQRLGWDDAAKPARRNPTLH